MEKVTRSEFLRKAATAGIDHLASAVEKRVEAFSSAKPRPPWAIEEARFIATCENCRTCGDYCPRGIIFHHGKAGQLATGTPYLDFHEDYCDFCGECVKVCPSGALNFDEGKKEIGMARLDAALCSNDEGDHAPCRSCIDACPEDAFLNSESGIPIVAPERCNGCGGCIPACPEVALIIKRQLFR